MRLIGVDTPESKPNKKLDRDAKRTGQDAKTIIEQGKEAAEFTRKLVEGKQVRLEYDVQKKDKYGRTLAYVWYEIVSDSHIKDIDIPSNFVVDLQKWKNESGHYGTFVYLNATLIKAGYAQVMTIPPNVKYQGLFVKLEKEAREQKRGLWK